MIFFDRIIFIWLIILISLEQINAHGRMEEPPARNAAWRYGEYPYEEIRSFILPFFLLGFNVPANYDDVGLNCGGLSIQKAYGKFLENEFSSYRRDI